MLVVNEFKQTNKLSIHTKSTIPWEANFVGSFVSMDSMPKKKLPTIAVIGRSNVGKSSFINSICNKKNLARVSATPGKTQTINFFEINQSFYLADMPGYGFAKVSKEKRKDWSGLSARFLSGYEHLLIVMSLIDANIPFQKPDQQFLEWCGENQVPFIIIRTKCDRSKPREVDALQNDFEKSLSESWEELPVIVRHSSISKLGVDVVKTRIEKIIANAKKR